VSGISTDLSSLEDETADLGNIQPKVVQEALDMASLPDTEPSMPREKPPSDVEVFVFELETSSRSRDCEIVVPVAVFKKSSFFKQINCFECNHRSWHIRRNWRKMSLKEWDAPFKYQERRGLF